MIKGQTYIQCRASGWNNASENVRLIQHHTNRNKYILRAFTRATAMASMEVPIMAGRIYEHNIISEKMLQASNHAHWLPVHEPGNFGLYHKA
jgi:hypothetical protein